MSDRLEALASEIATKWIPIEVSGWGDPERQLARASRDNAALKADILAALHAAGQWVSVGRKPPEGDYFTCEHRPNEGGTKWDLAFFYKGEWRSSEYGTIIHPTHYMPLTKPHQAPATESDCIAR